MCGVTGCAIKQSVDRVSAHGAHDYEFAARPAEIRQIGFSIRRDHMKRCALVHKPGEPTQLAAIFVFVCGKEVHRRCGYVKATNRHRERLRRRPHANVVLHWYPFRTSGDIVARHQSAHVRCLGCQKEFLYFSIKHGKRWHRSLRRTRHGDADGRATPFGYARTSFDDFYRVSTRWQDRGESIQDISLIRIWTPPGLQATVVFGVGYECTRISGLF